MGHIGHFDRALMGAVGLATVFAAALGFAGTPIAEAQAPETRGQAAAPAKSPVDLNTLKAQVILSKLGFSSGLLDGKNSVGFKGAIRGFQESRGLGLTGRLDAPTVQALSRFEAVEPVKTITLAPQMIAGPFVNPIPKDYSEQAKLPGLAYRSPLEKLAEMFHTSPEVLVALNSRETPLKAGQQIVVPNALPSSRDYDIDDATWKRTVAYLNVDARQPTADHVVVDESEGVLKVMNAEDRVIAQFPATMGSAEFPLPIGEWTIKGTAFNPDWKFQPELIAGSKPGAKEAVVPPGPNNPVGVVWMDLSKPHYGIHGTPEPQNIGKTESNGCIRLTNWDAARLALMVKPGTKAIFRK
ncbi:L,D-transpeptidase [Sphingomonas sp. Y38-1Y]|uniref:L,D-transpeptidase family protein n=1 Tax=Sphingomonas sp. Y38-1Y TaxID=3078265 RepID=UPI0028ECF10E|nr:L,D-transpeptidase [Sphingomonas sp. Y38-1Y]